LTKYRFEGRKGQLFDPKSGTFLSSKLSFDFYRIIRVKKNDSRAFIATDYTD